MYRCKNENLPVLSLNGQVIDRYPSFLLSAVEGLLFYYLSHHQRFLPAIDQFKRVHTGNPFTAVDHYIIVQHSRVEFPRMNDPAGYIRYSYRNRFRAKCF